MRHGLILALLIVLVIFTVVLINLYKPSKAAFSVSSETTVSAIIGEPLLALYGYTSPKSEVFISVNPNTFLSVYADQDGYFRFNNVYLLPNNKEICLTTVDQQRRTTTPVCIPSPNFPLRNKEIGPVILPPTIAIEKGQFLAEETVAASGYSLPKTEITISLFRAEPTFWQRLLPIVFAVSLPIYTVKTDQNGYFSFNLPSNSTNVFRIFAQAYFNQSPSPKSNTLTFKVLNIFEYYLEKIRLILALWLIFLKKLPLWETLTTLQIMVILSLIWFKKQTTSSKQIQKRRIFSIVQFQSNNNLVLPDQRSLKII